MCNSQIWTFLWRSREPSIFLGDHHEHWNIQQHCSKCASWSHLCPVVGAGSSLQLQTAFSPCPTAAWHCLCYARFTSPLYYLPYPGIELPTSLWYRSLLITTLLILSIVPGLDSRTALWLSASCSPHAKILHHAYRTASHLGASCITSLLYDPYLPHACLMYALLTPCWHLMTHLCPIGYNPLI